MLLLIRVSALVIASPIFGRVNIPNIAKIGLVATLTYMFFFYYPPVSEISYTSLFGFALICMGEALIGITLAFITNMFFALTFTAGQMIDMQIGFGIVNVYDAQNNTQIPMMGNLLNIILLMVFFGVNGHHRLIEILYLTFDRLPVGNLGFDPNIGITVVEIFAMSFMLGVMVALPIIASGIVLEFAFGMLMRTVPQLNMFVVGIPIKMLLGFLMVFMLIPVFVNFSDTIFTEMFNGVEKMFNTFLVSP